MSVSGESISLQTCLDRIAQHQQRGWFDVPAISIEPGVEGIEILQKILCAVVKNKHLDGITLSNLLGDQAFLAAINSKEFQDFLSQLIKENSERLHFMERLVRNLDYRLSKDNYRGLQKVLLQTQVSAIPACANNWFTVPRIPIEPNQGGMDYLKSILSAVAKNKSISSIYLDNVSRNREFSEAINSEDFQGFLSELIKENSERLGFFNSLLKELCAHLQLSEDREAVLQGMLLEICLGTISRQSGVLTVPKISMEPSKEGGDILKKTLAEAARNKNIQYVMLSNLERKKFSEVVNSKEFVEFLLSLIKENSGNLVFFENLFPSLSSTLGLSKDNHDLLQSGLQNGSLQVCLKAIPSQSGQLIIPAMRIEPDKDGVDIFKQILLAAVKNKNIYAVELCYLSENKGLSEAINSEEFQGFLSGLIRGNNDRLSLLDSLLRNLAVYLKLSEERGKVLQGFLLEACLDVISQQNYSFTVPRIIVGPDKSSIYIFKRILFAAIKNKNIDRINLQNLMDNKELFEAINTQEFQEFLCGMIKENGERHSFLGGLLKDLRDYLKLSEERGKVLQGFLLEACLDNIPGQSDGALIVPTVNIEIDKEGILILKKILSAAIKNKNIVGIDLRNLLENKAWSEAINSQEFQEFLSGLIKDNSENLRFMDEVLRHLVYSFKVSKEKEEVLRNEVMLAAMIPFVPGPGQESMFYPGSIMLNSFFKHPLQLEALKEKLTHLDTRYGWRSYQLEINVSKLGALEAGKVAEFLRTIYFPGGIDSITIVCDNVLEDCKTIIEFLEITKKANLKGLNLQGAFGALDLKTFEAIIQSILSLPWMEKLGLCSTQLERLKDQELLTFAGWLRQSTRLRSLTLAGNQLEVRPVSCLNAFVSEIVKVQTITELSLWWQFNALQGSEAWTAEDRQAFIALHLQLIPKDNSHYSCLASSPITGLVSKQEECDLLCQLMKDNPEHRQWHQIMKWAPNFSEPQRFALAECHLKLDGDPRSLRHFKLSDEQRLELFLHQGSKFLADNLLNFAKLQDDDDDDMRLGIFDCKFSGRAFIDAWKTMNDDNLPVSEEDLGEYDFDQLKTEAMTKLIPALEEANQTVWKGKSFYQAPFEQVKKQFGKSSDADPVIVFRSVQLLQWYTWLMSKLSKLELAEPAVFSPVLKELAGYPDRTTRYKLSEALLLLLETRQGQDLYSRLIKREKGSSLRLPEILLAGIILNIFSEKPGQEKERKESKENAEQDELFKVAREISMLLSTKYNDGHYMRALISSLYVLSQTRTLTSKQKLLLVKNLLQPSPQFLETERSLVSYFKTLKSRSISAQVVKEELTKLLGEYSAMVLAGFSRYFPKDQLKNLEPREINALSRGVLEKFRQFEHEKAFREQLSNWYLVEGFTSLDEIAVLAEKAPDQYGKTLYEIFQKIFQLDNGQMQFYKGAFAGQRNETALLTYLGKIRSLKQGDRKALEETFQSIVKSLLTEHQSLFYQKRYEIERSEHLKVVLEDPGLRERWSQNQRVGFNEFLEKNNIVFKPFKPDYIKFLISKIYQHNHLNSADYPLLKRYLEHDKDAKITGEVKEILERELKRFKDMSVEESAKDKDKDKDQKKIVLRFQLQLALIQLVESGSKVTDGELKNTQESEQMKAQRQHIGEALGCLRKLREGFEFINDLSGLLKSLNMPKRSLDLRQSEDWRIVFTDHYWDLFMCGTDVEGSCQRVDGDPRLNQCLVAYVWDGKIKMVAIKDGAGKIIARCMVRLLWDEQERTPVLYLEESYPHFLRSEQILAIEKFAIHLAEDLNIPLVSASPTETSVKYQNQLVSLSGIGPEYVDAIYSVTENGAFTIPHSQILVQPSRERRLQSERPTHFIWQQKPQLNALEVREAEESKPLAGGKELLEEEQLRPIVPEESAGAEGESLLISRAYNVLQTLQGQGDEQAHGFTEGEPCLFTFSSAAPQRPADLPESARDVQRQGSKSPAARLGEEG